MGNPYHDEQGLFTSKEKMGAEVNRLRDEAINGATAFERGEAMDKWLNLQREYDALTTDTVSVSKEWLSRSASSGSMTIPNDPATMRAYYEGIREQMTKITDTQHGEEYVLSSKAIALLKNPDLPEDVREDIYANASDAVKGRMVREMGYRDASQYFSVADVMKLVPKEGPIGPELGSEIASLSGSNAFTFEQRFDIAKRSGNVSRLIAYGTPEAAFKSTETETALVEALVQERNASAENGQLSEDAAIEQRRGWEALATRARKESTHKMILQRYADGDTSDAHAQATLRNDPAYVLLRENKHIKTKLVNQLFTRLAKDDVVRFDQLADAYSNSQHADTNLRYVLRRYSNLEGISDRFYREPSAAETANLQMATTSLHSSRVERINAQAKLDAMPANLKALKRELAQVQKQRRRSNDPQLAERYEQLYTRRVNGERARFANKVMNYWASEFPNDFNKD